MDSRTSLAILALPRLALRFPEGSLTSTIHCQPCMPCNTSMLERREHRLGAGGTTVGGYHLHTLPVGAGLDGTREYLACLMVVVVQCIVKSTEKHEWVVGLVERDERAAAFVGVLRCSQATGQCVC